MEQKDYILREIEKIGVLMQYLLGKIIPKENEEEIMTTEEVDTMMTREAGLSLMDLARIPPDRFSSFFSDKKGFTFENMELLANLMYQLSLNKVKDHLMFGQQALNIYLYIDESGHTYSFTRATRIQTLLKLLDQKE